MGLPFRNRQDAGRQLAEKLGHYAGRKDAIVLGLPRGGVPVAYEAALQLDLPLDIFLVRKLGVPGHEELAMGAIASGGVQVMNDEVVGMLRIPPGAIEAVAISERRELARRERLYRGSRPAPDVRGRTVILVDDGLATGSTLRAAITALKEQKPARIVVGVPVAAPSSCEEVRATVDEFICRFTPEPFLGVGAWYRDFSPTPDAEVRELLARAEQRDGISLAGIRAVEGGAPAPAPRETTARSTHSPASSPALGAVLASARPLGGGERDYDGILELIGDARFVLIGEASHGTHEFYETRAEITKRLIEQKGFAGVAAEADWPNASRVNRFVRHQGEDGTAEESLRDFERFPQWMWRNTVMVDFVTWLRRHNEKLSTSSRAGFYGLDLYSLHASIDAVIDYLKLVDPEAAGRARARYSCFDHFGDDAQAYGYATSLGAAEPCEEAVVSQLVEMQRRAADLAGRDGRLAEDAFFQAEQNARLARNAEAYYRSLFRGRVSSWNLRDSHMGETLEALVKHLDRDGRRSRIVVWAHNSHLGDARATAMGAGGELNLGQLVRQRHEGQAVLIGFTTHRGTVTAARDWGAPAERRNVRPSHPESYERLLHDAGLPAFLLDLRTPAETRRALDEPRLERAIGVIYKPETERFSHYFDARLSRQFDLVIHLDETRAVEPLERQAGWEEGELPETFPFAE